MSSRVSWREAAACRDADPDLFFPVGTAGPALRQVQEAKRIGRVCSAQAPCLAWAQRNCDWPGAVKHLSLTWAGLRGPGPGERMNNGPCEKDE